MTSNQIGINRYPFNRESVIKRRVPLCRGRYVILLFVSWTTNALPISLFFNLSQINYQHLLQYRVQKQEWEYETWPETVHTRLKLVSLKKASVGWRPRWCQESAGCTMAYLASIPQEVFDVEIHYQYLSMSDCHFNEAPLTPNCNTFWRHTPLAQCDFLIHCTLQPIYLLRHAIKCWS